MTRVAFVYIKMFSYIYQHNHMRDFTGEDQCEDQSENLHVLILENKITKITTGNYFI